VTWIKVCTTAGLVALALSSQVRAEPNLPAIPKGDIAIDLRAIATGLAAPDYAISPPGDASRLFVLEQNGLLRVIQNGTLLSTSALDLQARVSPPLNPANPNEERGLLGLAFAPGYSNPNNSGFQPSTLTRASLSRQEFPRPTPRPTAPRKTTEI